jgi:hypothetical protein
MSGYYNNGWDRMYRIFGGGLDFFFLIDMIFKIIFEFVINYFKF